MSSIHFKFKSSLNYDTLNFDGPSISLADLRNEIIQQKKLGSKSSEFKLQVINAQNNTEYTNEKDMIAKGSSVIVARIPTTDSKKQPWMNTSASNIQDVLQSRYAAPITLEALKETADLARANASEQDKIRAMMDQSTKEYSQSNYEKSKFPTAPVPPNYVCFKCGQTGHWKQNCQYDPADSMKIRRSTGIPMTCMIKVDNPNHPGAKITADGQYYVPVVENNAYTQPKKEIPLHLSNSNSTLNSIDESIPSELVCTLCNMLLRDAVVIPCCGNSYCDDCIRNALLDSEDHKCPSCGEIGQSPDALIANKFLRTAVRNYLNETGYTKSIKEAEPSNSPVYSHNSQEIVSNTVASSHSSTNVPPAASSLGVQTSTVGNPVLVRASVPTVRYSSYNTSSKPGPRLTSSSSAPQLHQLRHSRPAPHPAPHNITTTYQQPNVAAPTQPAYTHPPTAAPTPLLTTPSATAPPRTTAPPQAASHPPASVPPQALAPPQVAGPPLAAGPPQAAGLPQVTGPPQAPVLNSNQQPTPLPPNNHRPSLPARPSAPLAGQPVGPPGIPEMRPAVPGPSSHHAPPAFRGPPAFNSAPGHRPLHPPHSGPLRGGPVGPSHGPPIRAPRLPARFDGPPSRQPLTPHEFYEHQERLRKEEEKKKAMMEDFIEYSRRKIKKSRSRSYSYSPSRSRSRSPYRRYSRSPRSRSRTPRSMTPPRSRRYSYSPDRRRRSRSRESSGRYRHSRSPYSPHRNKKYQSSSSYRNNSDRRYSRSPSPRQRYSSPPYNYERSHGSSRHDDYYSQRSSGRDHKERIPHHFFEQQSKYPKGRADMFDPMMEMWYQQYREWYEAHLLSHDPRMSALHQDPRSLRLDYRPPGRVDKHDSHRFGPYKMSSPDKKEMTYHEFEKYYAKKHPKTKHDKYREEPSKQLEKEKYRKELSSDEKTKSDKISKDKSKKKEKEKEKKIKKEKKKKNKVVSESVKQCLPDQSTENPKSCAPVNTTDTQSDVPADSTTGEPAQIESNKINVVVSSPRKNVSEKFSKHQELSQSQNVSEVPTKQTSLDSQKMIKKPTEKSTSMQQDRLINKKNEPNNNKSDKCGNEVQKDSGDSLSKNEQQTEKTVRGNKSPDASNRPVADTKKEMIPAPEPSKWEREGGSDFEHEEKKSSKSLEKKSLPRSVIEKAEKVYESKHSSRHYSYDAQQYEDKKPVKVKSEAAQPSSKIANKYVESQIPSKGSRVSSIKSHSKSSSVYSTKENQKSHSNCNSKDSRSYSHSEKNYKNSNNSTSSLSRGKTVHGERPSFDEANFEPDYDEKLDSEGLSSSSPSESPSQSPQSKKRRHTPIFFSDESESRHKKSKKKHKHSEHKKHKKHKKHKHKKTSSSDCN